MVRQGTTDQAEAILARANILYSHLLSRQISSILLSSPQLGSVNILNCQCASTCFSWLIFYNYQDIINILRKHVPKIMTGGWGMIAWINVDRTLGNTAKLTSAS